MKEFLSISDLANKLNQSFEESFNNIKFEGEISQITFATSGHIYFTVKDKDSQLSAAMWRSSASKLRFKPKMGMLVQCIGTANIFSKSGRFQMLVARMREAGEGDLQQKYLELKNKLENEGLFDIDRKRELPFLPKTIGIVTSETGAALQDILVKIRERAPQTLVLLVHAKVQGPGSAEDVVYGIQKLNKDGRAEVIIIGRGGGSLEDLFAFNEEIVVRAVFSSKIPIISAVGHEVDIALSDLAADKRAPTPTSAGVMVVPDCSELLIQLEKLETKLKNYERWLLPFEQLLDDKLEALNRSVKNKLANLKLELKNKANSIKLIEPSNLIRAKTEKLKNLSSRLHLSLKLNLKNKSNSLDYKLKLIEALNQKSILKRGFSIVRNEKGKIITSAKNLTENEIINVNFADDSIHAKVIGK